MSPRDKQSMSTAVTMARIAEASPRFKARRTVRQ
jgi:hypothetical protein